MPTTDNFLQSELLQVAYRMADAARPIALRHFRQSATMVDNKALGGFDPVTIADRDIETAFRKILATERPNDAIKGEEFDDIEGTSGLTWILDPIDGTRGYITGTPTWGVLISVADASGPILGIVDQPFTGERFVGGFGSAVHHHRGASRALKTRDCTKLSEAVLYTTFPEIGTELERQAFQSVVPEVKMTRYGLDCYAYALVAAGQVDLVIEAGLNPFDIAAPIAVIEHAGGKVTTWAGGPAIEGGRILAAATPELHDAAQKLLQQVVADSQ